MCINGGVDTKKAKMMYAAVYTKGPRWLTPEDKKLQKSNPDYDPGKADRAYKKIIAILSNKDISLDEIDYVCSSTR